MSADTCTEVSELCPVEATVLGYYPNLGINAFFAAGFGLCFVALVSMGAWKRTWGYSSALAAGSALEFAGYVARTQLHFNPWNQNAFETQICAIILAPTLICISVYLTLKHITLSAGPELSRIQPRLYPIIFVPADVSCLVLQAIGGGLAASSDASGSQTLLKAGDYTIITGIALQCIVLGFFGVMSVDYWRRVRAVVAMKGTPSGGESSVGVAANPKTLACWNDGKLRTFCAAVAVAYVGIMIRCIYRIAEMAGGWGNVVMQDEWSFVVLEGFMILIPTAILTIFTPGIFFTDMARRESRRRFLGIGKKRSRNVDSDSDDERAQQHDAEKAGTTSSDDNEGAVLSGSATAAAAAEEQQKGNLNV